jgi:triosephosphate isomerase (TIM)
MRAYLVAGNWKMNGSRAANGALLAAIKAGLDRCADVETCVCPPSPYLESVGTAVAGSRIALGAQNVSEQDKPGAFTGEVHAAMLGELGCRYVIVGHSERRALYGEDDVRVAQKFRVALAHKLTPILCVGELLAEREAGQTENVLERQLNAVLELNGIGAFANAVIAYEPVWAIGTGRTATPAQAQEAHAFLRGRLGNRDARIAALTRILYGGSVKGDNARELFAGADVDGGLIGGASLKADEFLTICAAAQAQVQN